VADLYSTLGAGSSRRVLTSSDSSGPETTWLLVYTTNLNWEGGETPESEVAPVLTTSDSINYRAIVEGIQTYCEVYEVVKAEYGELSIKVRNSSVPYTGEETRGDRSVNTALTAILQAHPDLGGAYTVYNARFRGDTVLFD
jgi:hypothetical protein